MNPSCKLPCYMNSSSTKMLQIPSKMRGSNSKMLQIPLKRQLPAPKCYKFHQHVAKSMENERFQLQNIAKTVEMAASSSKMYNIILYVCIYLYYNMYNIIIYIICTAMWCKYIYLYYLLHIMQACSTEQTYNDFP